MMGALLMVLATRPAAAQAVEQPFLGVWAHASQTKSAAEADELMDRVAAAGIDAIYMLVWYWGGHAYYVTDLAPMPDGLEPGFDPLGYLVEGCHRRGIELHAWYVNGSSGSPTPGVVFEKHPDWRMVDRGGNPLWWYDLGRPEVRQFESDLMIDVLERYDVDGVHFDYIRHPGRQTCYCEHCVAAFERETGLDVGAFRADAVPCALFESGNPLDQPTTATVLARFAGGVPAVYLNRLGEGRVLGLNYHAHGLSEGFAREAVRRFLADAETAGGVPVIWPPETAANYRSTYPDAFVQALRGLGHESSRTDGSRVADLPRGGAAALVCAYRVSEPLAADLRSFVERGGHLVIVDGPVFSMGIADLQTLTGMGGTARYFNETTTIAPEEPSDLLPVTERAVDPEALAGFEAAWEAFQMQGPTELVRDVRRRAQEARPDAKVTAAVFYNRSHAAGVYQDWYRWLEEDLVDYVIPMCYVMNSDDLEAALDEWQAFDPGWERIVPGLSIYQRVEGKAVSRPPELVLDQVGRCLKRGTGGTVFFSAHYLDAALTHAIAGVKAP